MSQTCPVYREWEFIPDDLAGVDMLEFRLIYQGLLLGSGPGRQRSEHVQHIRRYLHRQLVNLWTAKHPLKGRIESYSAGGEIYRFGKDDLTNLYSLGNKRFLPVVSYRLELACSLDILLLRRDLGTILESGDLDNRIKTLIDALRIPRAGEIADGDEDPLYCLMEDDKLVTEIRVLADALLAEPEQIIENPKTNLAGEYTVSPNHVCAIIHCTVKTTRLMLGNLDFA